MNSGLIKFNISKGSRFVMFHGI